MARALFHTVRCETNVYCAVQIFCMCYDPWEWIPLAEDCCEILVVKFQTMKCKPLLIAYKTFEQLLMECEQPSLSTPFVSFLHSAIYVEPPTFEWHS